MERGDGKYVASRGTGAGSRRREKIKREGQLIENVEITRHSASASMFAFAGPLSGRSVRQASAAVGARIRRAYLVVPLLRHRPVDRYNSLVGVSVIYVGVILHLEKSAYLTTDGRVTSMCWMDSSRPERMTRFSRVCYLHSFDTDNSTHKARGLLLRSRHLQFRFLLIFRPPATKEHQ